MNLPSVLKRRDFMRFLACARDLSLESPDAPLPEAAASGDEPFLVVGAITGGVGRLEIGRGLS